MNDPSYKSKTEEVLEANRNVDLEEKNKLFELIYPELRRLAHSMLKHERHNHTLQATALVHEAYRKMFNNSSHQYGNRTHFFRAAAEVMHLILIEYARNRNRKKRSGIYKIESIDELDKNTNAAEKGVDLIRLDEGLKELEKVDKMAAEIVKLRYFGGLTNDEVSEVMNIPLKAVKDDWAYAKAWLNEYMK